MTSSKLESIIRLGMLPAIILYCILNINEAKINFAGCLFTYFLDVECWGCGMTRAILELSKMDLEKAIAFNPLSPFVLVLIVFIFYLELFKLGRAKWQNLRSLNNR